MAGGEHEAVHTGGRSEQREPIGRIGSESRPGPQHVELGHRRRDPHRMVEDVSDTRRRERAIQPHEAARATDDEVARRHLRDPHALARGQIGIIVGLAWRILRPGLVEAPHVPIGLDGLQHVA